MSQPTATAEQKNMKEYTERIKQFSARTHDYLASGRKIILSRELYYKLVNALRANDMSSPAWKCLTAQEEKKARNYTLFTKLAGRHFMKCLNGKFAVHDQQLVQIIAAAHQKLGCAPFSSLYANLSRIYYSIPRLLIKDFVKGCPICEERR